MSNTLKNMADILNRGVSGFHQYVLSAPAHLSFVSQNLCELLGVCEGELLHETEDLYAQRVHPADRMKYAKWIQTLSEGEQTRTCEYRLLKKDGTAMDVRDTLTARKLSDGTLVGDSVLTDITDIKSENNNLQFLSETIPCGFLKYTCEKQPRITYLNQKMVEMLRLPESKSGELDYFDMYTSNVFLMVPMEERRRFSKYLNRVFSAEAPIAGEMTLLRCDGTRANVFGWVTKCINDDGVPEFQSVCMDITDRHKAKRSGEIERYIKVLSDVYDKIFEFNVDLNTVKCLYCKGESIIKRFEGIAMQMDDALEKWVISAVVSDEQEAVRAFFSNLCQKRLYLPDAKPPQITYRAKSSQGGIKKYNGVFIKVDESVSFYCCRNIPDEDAPAAPAKENGALKENVKNLLRRFDGLAAFEVSPDGRVKPLYASENVYTFFGYTEEEWKEMMEHPAPFDNFVAYSEASYDEFTELLRNGEAEFTYFDYQSETERRMKAICSQRDPNSNAPRYVMLYSVDDSGEEKKKGLPENHAVSIRTFGYFDVFVGDKPIAFRNKKSKELLALLVDRRGGYVTSEEAIAFLWEDEPVNTVTMSRYRKVALRLKNTLEEYGISDIVGAVDGKRRIVMEKVQCDLYNYLSGKEEYAHLFKGSYLTNYSWGETTLGELSNHLE